MVIVGKASADAEGTLFTSVICNGTNGKAGATGKAGSVTVITKDAAGNVIDTVGELPHTGGSDLTWWLLGVGGLVVVGGVASIVVLRRNQHL